MPHVGEVMAVLSDAPAVQAVAIGASPSSYIVPSSGKIVVRGGTVSLIEIGRRGTFVTTGLITAVLPVSRGDVVRITYIVAPTVNYLRD